MSVHIQWGRLGDAVADGIKAVAPQAGPVLDHAEETARGAGVLLRGGNTQQVSRALGSAAPVKPGHPWLWYGAGAAVLVLVFSLAGE